jgi:hypothetical protein
MVFATESPAAQIGITTRAAEIEAEKMIRIFNNWLNTILIQRPQPWSQNPNVLAPHQMFNCVEGGT